MSGPPALMGRDIAVGRLDHGAGVNHHEPHSAERGRSIANGESHLRRGRVAHDAGEGFLGKVA